MESESDVQQHIQIAAVHYNCFLMRNNSGALKDATGRLVRYGLGNISQKHNDQIKSSDLIGFTIRNGVAVFTAIEVKEPGWNPKLKIDRESFEVSYKDPREAAQNNFIQWVIAKGGIAGFCASVADFKKLMESHV